MQTDLTSSTAVAASLQRLSENLHSLLHSMAGEEPSEAHKDSPARSADEELALLDRLLDNREDWAMERESEIARLEAENEELRRLLGIDRAHVAARGWLEDEARELAASRYVPIVQQHREPSPGAQGDLRAAAGMSPFINITTGAPPQGQQRPVDQMQPGMRMTQGRRPGMFGQRGRGGGPALWEGAAHPPPIQERPWQAQVGLDLS